jgi:hypothetical protein
MKFNSVALSGFRRGSGIKSRGKKLRCGSGCGLLGRRLFIGAIMGELQRLQLGKPHESPHIAGMPFGQNRRFAQLAPFVAGSAAHQVRRKAVMPLHLAGSRHLKSLGDGLGWLVLVTHRILVK